MEATLESKPSVCFEVEKVIGISSDGNYQVQWAPAWVSRFHLVGCEHLIQEYLQQQQKQKQQQQQQQPSVKENARQPSEEFLQQQERQKATKETERRSQHHIPLASDEACGESIQVTHVHSLQDETTIPTERNCAINPRDIVGGTAPGHMQSSTGTSLSQSSIDGGNIEDSAFLRCEDNIQSKSDEIDCCIKIEDNEEGNDTLPLLALVVKPIHQTNLNNNNSDSCTGTATLSADSSPDATPEKPWRLSEVETDATPDEASMYSVIQPEVSINSKPYERNSHTSVPPFRKKKRFMCSVCEKHFPHKSNLLIHFRTHTGLKPFRCEFCSKTFTQSHHLKDHVRLHTNEKPYSCEGCGKTFKTTGNCKSHMYRCKSVK